MFSKLKNYVNSFSPQKPTQSNNDPPVNTTELSKSQPTALAQPITFTMAAPTGIPASPSITNDNAANSQLTFSLDSIWRPKKTSLPAVKPIVFEEEKDSWKNIQSNAGTFLIKRYEICWKLLHENNIDLAREAEKADRNIHVVIGLSNKHQRGLREFEQTVTMIPLMIHQMTKLSKQVEDVRKRLEAVEKVFDQVAATNFQKSIDRWKSGCHEQLMAYEATNKNELVKLEKQLKSHKTKLPVIKSTITHHTQSAASAPAERTDGENPT